MLFWSPTCGFCNEILGDLKDWEARRRPHDVELLVVSTGGVRENRALGFRSRVVLDDGFEAARAFGSPGTPSAVLVSSEGRISSDMAVGAQAVIQLCRTSAGRVEDHV